MHFLHGSVEKPALLTASELEHTSPQEIQSEIGQQTGLTLLKGMTMTRLITAAALMLSLLGTTACSDTATKHRALTNFQVSSVHWDEMAAASTAAHVTNNGLIMMR